MIFFFKQKTAYEMRISDWSSDVCSSDLAKVGGDDAAARAIVDLSGNVDLVENSGAISATGAKDAADNIAIDLSANSSGAIVKQTAVASGVTAPSLAGDIRFGGGTEVLDNHTSETSAVGKQVGQTGRP